jgi:hypothetical protein
MTREQTCEWVDSGAFTREIAAVITGRTATYKTTKAALAALRQRRNGIACIGMVGEMLAATESLMRQHWPSVQYRGSDLDAYPGLVEAKLVTCEKLVTTAQIRVSRCQLANRELAEFAVSIIGLNGPDTITHARIPAAELQAYIKARYRHQIRRGGTITVTLPVGEPAFAQYLYRRFSDVVEAVGSAKRPRV